MLLPVLDFSVMCGDHFIAWCAPERQKQRSSEKADQRSLGHVSDRMAAQPRLSAREFRVDLFEPVNQASQSVVAAGRPAFARSAAFGAEGSGSDSPLLIACLHLDDST